MKNLFLAIGLLSMFALSGCETSEVGTVSSSEPENTLEENRDSELKENTDLKAEESTDNTKSAESYSEFKNDLFSLQYPSNLTPKQEGKNVDFASASGEVAMRVVVQEGDVTSDSKQGDVLTYSVYEEPNTYSLIFDFLTEENEMSKKVHESFKVLN